MKRLLRCLILLVVIALLAPHNDAYAAPALDEGTGDAVILGEPLTLVSGSMIRPAFSGCSRIDFAPINDAYEQRVVELVNQHRAEHGLPPLKRVTNLDFAARYHAADMATDNYFNHNTYDGWGGAALVCDTWTRLRLFMPNLGWGGENIAAGFSTPEDAMRGWINSAGHHENIVRPQFNEIGVGYYTGRGNYGSYWVQDFDSRSDVYPLVINQEAAATTSQLVSLYIYGEGVWNEMRLRNDNEPWADWQPFNKSFSWTLPCTSTTHTVSVELRKYGQTTAAASASDSIFLQNGNGAVSFGNLPVSLTFLYAQNEQRFSSPVHTFQPLNSASSQTMSWSVTKSDFENPWLVLSAESGVTPNSAFTVTPTNVGGILDIIGDHAGVLTFNATAMNPQCPATTTITVPVHLIVVYDLLQSFLPWISR